MGRSLLRSLALLLALAGPAGMAAAQVYRWVDAQGVTHYGPKPPPGVKAAEVGTGAPVSAAAASQAQAQRQRLLQQADQLATQRQRGEAAEQQQGSDAQRRGAERLQRCVTARQQLGVLEQGGPAFVRNERGERVPVEDAQRDAALARLRAEVAASCDEANPAQEAAQRQRNAEAATASRCHAARDAVRDLEAMGPRVTAWELEQARARVQQACPP